METTFQWHVPANHDTDTICSLFLLQTNLISAMIKYGTDKKRFDGLTKDDLQLAAEALDPELMQLFNYEIPSL